MCPNINICHCTNLLWKCRKLFLYLPAFISAKLVVHNSIERFSFIKTKVQRLCIVIYEVYLNQISMNVNFNYRPHIIFYLITLHATVEHYDEIVGRKKLHVVLYIYLRKTCCVGSFTVILLSLYYLCKDFYEAA